MFLYFLHDVMIVFLPVQLTAYNETANLVSNTDTIPCSVFRVHVLGHISKYAKPVIECVVDIDIQFEKLKSWTLFCERFCHFLVIIGPTVSRLTFMSTRKYIDTKIDEVTCTCN